MLQFDDDDGKSVFWHSSAHILGEAMERVYGGHLCYGPPIEEGFYYDMFSDDYKVCSFVKINGSDPTIYVLLILTFFNLICT